MSHKQSRHIVIAGIAAVSTACLGLTAASTAASAAATRVPVSFWTLSSNSVEQAAQQAVVNAFNKSYPGGDVSVDFIENTPYKTKIAVAIAAHHPPTIFYTWGGRLFDQWVAAGQVQSLTGVLAKDKSWYHAFLPTVWPLASYKGQVYGVPNGGPGLEALFYNKAVLEKAGVKSVPSTWPEFLSDAAAVKNKVGVAPIALAGATEWPEMIWLQYLTLRYGGPSVFNNIAAGKANAWDTPAVIKAAQQVQILSKDGYFEPGFDAVHYGAGATDELMAAGRAAFQAMGDWDYSAMENDAPSFVKSGSYNFTTFPAVPGGRFNTELVGEPAAYYAVAKDATPAQKAEAIAFLKYITTSSGWNLNYLEKNGNLPVDVNYAKDLPHYTGGAVLLRFYRLAQHATYLQDYWDQDLPSGIVTPMLTDIGELFTLSITPQKFVSSLDEVLAKNG